MSPMQKKLINFLVPVFDGILLVAVAVGAAFLVQWLARL